MLRLTLVGGVKAIRATCKTPDCLRTELIVFRERCRGVRQVMCGRLPLLLESR